jgi:uncharacterized protein (DUF58 family)
VVDDDIELAREFAAEFTVNAAREDPAEVISSLHGTPRAIAPRSGPEHPSRPTDQLRRGKASPGK